MDLGLAALAGNAAISAGRRQQEFEHAQALRDAEQAVLPDRMAAERARLQGSLADARDRETLRTPRLQNEQTKLGLDAADLAARGGRQATENATKDLQASAGLNQARADLDAQPGKIGLQQDQQKIDRALMDVSIDELPMVIARKRREGAMSDAQAGIASVAKLADLVEMGDQQGSLRFINAMRSVFAGDGGMGSVQPPAASVGVGQDPATGERTFEIKDATGKVLRSITRSQFERARTLVGAGPKTEVKTVNPGDTLVGVRGGKATPLYTAPETEKSKAAKAGPLERDVDYLVRAHGMTPQAALQHLNSAKAMSREQFILKSIQDATMPGKQPQAADVEALGQLYDKVTGSRQPTQSNSKPVPTMPSDPAVRSLLGIP